MKIVNVKNNRKTNFIEINLNGQHEVVAKYI